MQFVLTCTKTGCYNYTKVAKGPRKSVIEVSIVIHDKMSKKAKIASQHTAVVAADWYVVYKNLASYSTFFKSLIFFPSFFIWLQVTNFAFKISTLFQTSCSEAGDCS